MGTVIEADLGDLADLSIEPLIELIESEDTWLRRAVDRIRAEASSPEHAFFDASL